MTIYIVTPTFNSVEYLEKTIESVVTQEVPIRYHIQDGLSSDGTIGLLEKWQHTLRGSDTISFSYASAKDSGMYDAINTAFASLDIPVDAFMGWINSDDVLFPGALRAVLEAAKSPAGIDWVYGIPANIDAVGNMIETPDDTCYPQAFVAGGVADGFLWCFFQQEGSFFRKLLWDKVGGCNSRFRLAGDWDLWRRMAVLEKPVRIPRKLAAFRQRKGQLSGDIAAYTAEIDSALSVKQRCEAMRSLAFSHESAAVQFDHGELLRFPLKFKARVRCFLLACGFRKFVIFVQAGIRYVKRIGL